VADNAGSPAEKAVTPEVVTADDRRAQVAAEYGKYIALAPIDAPDGTARIFNPLDPIPVSFVEGKEYPWLSADDERVGLTSRKTDRNKARRAVGLSEEA
jgi:hypothetical protein